LVKAVLNMPEVAAVSARAFTGFRAVFRSLVKDGTNPHVSRSRWRSPLSGCRRTTGALMVGAMFQVGRRLGSGFVVPNKRAINSGGRKEAYRPHIHKAPLLVNQTCAISDGLESVREIT
jgi:hypothetical protein